MYKVKHIQFMVEDTIDNLDNLLAHPNILIKKFQKQMLWTNYGLIKGDINESYKNTTLSLAIIDCYLKVKHSRRLKELDTSWIISAKDVLSVVK